MTYRYEWQTCALEFAPDFSLTARFASRFDSDEPADKRGPLPFGASLWPAAIVLIQMLRQKRDLLLAAQNGGRVLELGCGLGLVAMAAAKLGCSDVVATDNHLDMPEFVSTNAALNGVTIRYAHLPWSEPTTERAAVVLASDVLYEPAACNALATAFENTLAPGGIGLVSDPGRPHARRFVDKLENRGFSVTTERMAIDSRLLMQPAVKALLAQHPTATRTHNVFVVRRPVTSGRAG